MSAPLSSNNKRMSSQSFAVSEAPSMKSRNSNVSRVSRAQSSVSKVSQNRRDGKGKRFGRDDAHRQSAYSKNKYEEELERYRQLAVKVQEQELAVVMSQDHLAQAKLTHEAKLTAKQDKGAQLRQQIADIHERIALKEIVADDNDEHIVFLQGIVRSDEVRRAYNFILRRTNCDIAGVKPEEVFDEAAMLRFYGTAHRRKNRKLQYEIKKAGQASSLAAGILVVVVAHLHNEMSAELQFRKAVLQSVGLAGQTANKWLADVRCNKPAAKDRTPSPSPPPTPPSRMPRVPPRWARYRLSFYEDRDAAAAAAPAPAKPARDLLAQCNAELRSLAAVDRAAGSLKPGERHRRLVALQSEEFEAQRTSAGSPAPEPYFWSVLPPPSMRTP
eukprot:gene15240-23276_t